eukprot:jgi/Chrzof1/8982/Cz03g31240.t1
MPMEHLKRAAELQMRRPAPGWDSVKHDGSNKKQRTEKQEDGGQLGRYSYTSPDDLLHGAKCFLVTCKFRNSNLFGWADSREKSATQECKDILKQYLPGTTKLHLVKTSCCGLVVLKLEGRDEVDVVDVASHIIQAAEQDKNKRTKHCQRIVPAEATCVMTADILAQSAQRLCTAWVSKFFARSDFDSKAVQFAVTYKSRGADATATSENAQKPSTQHGNGSHLERENGLQQADKQSQPQTQTQWQAAGQQPLQHNVSSSNTCSVEGQQIADTPANAEGQAAQCEMLLHQPCQPQSSQQTVSQHDDPKHASHQPDASGHTAGAVLMTRSEVIAVLAAAMHTACEVAGGTAEVNLMAPQV